jgi:hypothetical protein
MAYEDNGESTRDAMVNARRAAVAGLGFTLIAFSVASFAILLSARTKGGTDVNGEWDFPIVAVGLAVLFGACLALSAGLRLRNCLERRIAAVAVGLAAGLLVGWPFGFLLYTLAGGSWERADVGATILSLIPGCVAFGAVAGLMLARGEGRPVSRRGRPPSG